MNRGRIGAGALTLATLACATTAATTAGAQENVRTGFGGRGEIVISADHLVPLVAYTSETVPNATLGVNGLTPVLNTNGTVKDEGAGISILWGSNDNSRTSGGVPAVPSFATTPRIGLDYFATDMLTVGLTVGAAFSTGGQSTTTTENGTTTSTTTTPTPTWAQLSIGGRVGVALRLTDTVSFWPRGGLSYQWGQSQLVQTGTVPVVNLPGTLTQTNNVSQLTLDIDPQLVWSPYRHIAFTLGLGAGIPLVSAATQGFTFVYQNNTTTSHVSSNANDWYVGGNLGLLVYF